MLAWAKCHVPYALSRIARQDQWLGLSAESTWC